MSQAILKKVITDTNKILVDWASNHRTAKRVNTIEGNSLFKTMMRKNFVEREVSAHFLRYCNAVIEDGQIAFLYMKRENQEGLDLIQSVDCKALRYVKGQEKAVEAFPLDLSTIQNINFHVNRGTTK